VLVFLWMPTRLVDRQRELQRLQQVAAAPPALVVLRGRRRVGKSYLLRSALSGPRVLSFQAEQQPLPLQLAAFARECSRLLPGAPPLAFANWGEAFAFLDAQAKANGPLVCILDEFQYLAANDGGLESTIQLWWDRWDRDDTPVVLVLSGSALSFMAGLFGGQAPTHGRSIYRPLLLPLTYRDIAPFAPKGATAIDLIERFAVLGGTPQYQRWAGQEANRTIVEDVILSPDAPLHRDPEHLIREEDDIREPGPYFGTLEAIADGYTTPTEIGGRIGASAQLATKYLKRLEELGYVLQVTPLEPGGKGESRSYWKISDPYFRFWFRYVLPNRSRLARGRIREVANEIERDLAAFVGPVFEDICREWIGSVSPLGASAREVGSWWNRKSDIEIDVVALDRKSYTVLGACKWWKEPAGENVLDKLIASRAALGPKASRAELVVFSKVGFNDKLTERAKNEGVHLIGVDELFR
jgi:uncharacterized protein